MKWPWISRKKHETMVLAERASKYERVKQLREDYEKVQREILKPMVDRFIKVEVEHRQQDYEKYRVRVSMETRWVEYVLLHGSSQRELEYLRDQIAYQVARELEVVLKYRNFIRK